MPDLPNVAPRVNGHDAENPLEALDGQGLLAAAKPFPGKRPPGWCDTPEGHLHAQARVELFKRMNRAIAAKQKQGGKKGGK